MSLAAHLLRALRVLILMASLGASMAGAQTVAVTADREVLPVPVDTTMTTNFDVLYQYPGCVGPECEAETFDIWCEIPGTMDSCTLSDTLVTLDVDEEVTITATFVAGSSTTHDSWVRLRAEGWEGPASGRDSTRVKILTRHQVSVTPDDGTTSVDQFSNDQWVTYKVHNLGYYGGYTVNCHTGSDTGLTDIECPREPSSSTTWQVPPADSVALTVYFDVSTPGGPNVDIPLYLKASGVVADSGKFEVSVDAVPGVAVEYLGNLTDVGIGSADVPAAINVTSLDGSALSVDISCSAESSGVSCASHGPISVGGSNPSTVTDTISFSLSSGAATNTSLGFTINVESGQYDDLATVSFNSHRYQSTVTAVPPTKTVEVGTAQQATFTVANTGSTPTTFTFGCSAPTSCGTSPGSASIGAGSSTTVTASYTAPASPGSGQVSVTSSVSYVAGSHLAQGSQSVTFADDDAYINVEPAAPFVNVQPSTSLNTTFAINYKGPQQNVGLEAICSGGASNCSLVTSTPISVGPGEQTSQVTISYTSPSTGNTGWVKLKATPADELPVDEDSIQVISEISMDLSVDHAAPGSELARGDCPTIAAGAGAIQCDDFLYAYGFLPVARMNRERTLNLIYNSATEHPQAVVAGHLTLPQGAVADSLRVRLYEGGTLVDSARYGSRTGTDQPIRIAFNRDLSSTQTGDDLVRYRMKVNGWFNNNQTTDSVEAEGYYLAVDRRDEFGRGWWPAGYEQVVVPQGADSTLLWIGGDGSARGYRQDAAANYVGMTRGRQDTITVTSSGGGTTDGGYLDLDGTERGAIAAGNHSGLMGQTKMTWAFWIRPTGSSGRIGGVYYPGDPHRVWWFEADNSGTELQVTLFNTAAGGGNGEPIYRVTENGTFTSGNWHFVVVQFDGTQSASDRLKVWVDGSSRSLVRPSWSPNYDLPTQLATSSSAPFEWGSLSQLSGGFSGYLGELAVVSDVLTSTERSAWESNGIDFSRSGLEAGYKFQGDLNDESANSNDLTGVNITSGDYGTTSSYPSRSAPVATSYVRHLIGGGEVHFTGSGRHSKTVDRNGNETQFVHTTVGTETRLSEIKLPTASGSSAAYRFHWSGSATLDSIQALGGEGAWRNYAVSSTVISGGSRINSIETPDGRTTSFSYSGGSGPLTSLTDPRGATTTVGYAHQKVASVQVSGSGISTMTLTYTPAGPVGTDTTGVLAPAVVDSVSALVQGVRGSADTTRIFVTGWGAGRGGRDPLGNRTRIEYENTSYPGLPTTVTYPNGRVVTTAYDSDGLTETVTDNAAASSAVTEYDWNVTWSRPTRIASPEGVVTRYTYDSNGNRTVQKVGADSVRFVYSAKGLVENVVDGEGHTRTLTYDGYGNLQGDQSALAFRTRYAKDAAGRDTLVVQPIASGDSMFVRTTRDVMGREMQVLTTSTVDSIWIRATMGYDPNTGDRTSVTTRGAHPTQDSVSIGTNTWLYDVLGRVIRETGAATDSLVYSGPDLVKRVTERDDEITMTYDILGRLRSRYLPAPDDAVQDTTAAIGPLPYQAVSIPAQTDTFTYDVMGNLLTADNPYAKVRRSYTLDGLVETDTLRVKDYGGSGFATHVFGLAYTYDRDRRLKSIVHPSTLVGTVTSYAYDSENRLDSVTDPLSNDYSFTYDDDGRVTLKTFPSGTETRSYDQDGRLKTRVLTVDGQTHMADTLTYDRRGKVLDVAMPTSTAEFSYSGLGHLETAITPGWPSGSVNQSSIGLDGFGNSVSTDQFPDEPGSYHTGYIQQFDSIHGGRMVARTEQWLRAFPTTAPSQWEPGQTTYAYDASGNRTKTTDVRYMWEIDGGGTVATKVSDHNEESRGFYSADQKLRVFQVNRDSTRYTPSEITEGRWGAYEEYWYDALGRRVMKLSYQGSPVCQVSAWCDSTIERVVWQGDQILWEVRQDGSGDLAPSSISGGDHTGTIGYVHAGETDAPVGMVRNGAGVVLHANWQGQYAFAHDSTGAMTTCTPSQSSGCKDVDWPAGSWWASLESTTRDTKVWYGSLVLGQRDESGLMYRRNRYYDPTSGQFTQEDPIGIAGGLNLYGYADGDPVNFSDPFGLCAPWPICLWTESGVRQAALSALEGFATSAKRIGDFFGGTDAVVLVEGRDPATGEQVGGLDRAMAGASLGAGLGGSAGFSAGQLAKFQGQLTQHGVRSVLRSQRNIQRRLDEHLVKLDDLRGAGGFTSSVEREIRNFRGELAAIDEVLRGIR